MRWPMDHTGWSRHRPRTETTVSYHRRHRVCRQTCCGQHRQAHPRRSVAKCPVRLPNRGHQVLARAHQASSRRNRKGRRSRSSGACCRALGQGTPQRNGGWLRKPWRISEHSKATSPPQGAQQAAVPPAQRQRARRGPRVHASRVPHARLRAPSGRLPQQDEAPPAMSGGPQSRLPSSTTGHARKGNAKRAPGTRQATAKSLRQSWKRRQLMQGCQLRRRGRWLDFRHDRCQHGLVGRARGVRGA
mmetsp:Transcript_58109/g.151447  ORF Transcript_58109/g.151447 Transcript_58109/m.151447 type:complete len:245 (+) Transcript_58109:865-1599(+)